MAEEAEKATHITAFVGECLNLKDLQIFLMIRHQYEITNTQGYGLPIMSRLSSFFQHMRYTSKYWMK